MRPILNIMIFNMQLIGLFIWNIFIEIICINIFIFREYENALYCYVISFCKGGSHISTISNSISVRSLKAIFHTLNENNSYLRQILFFALSGLPNIWKYYKLWNIFLGTRNYKIRQHFTKQPKSLVKMK